MTQYYITRRGEKREIPKDEENWRAPEHARMSAGLRRSRGVKNADGTWAFRPGELIVPLCTAMKLQKQTEWILRNPGLQIPKELK
jgi:hypothetical protein